MKNYKGVNFILTIANNVYKLCSPLSMIQKLSILCRLYNAVGPAHVFM
jgi:hypothetical protein